MDDRILLGLVIGGIGGGALLLYNYGKEQFDYFLEKRKENQLRNEKEKIDNQPINRNLKSIETLEELKESGLLTEKEYQEKAQKLRDIILLEQIKETEEYNKLKSLFDSGVLTDNEFANKINELKISFSKRKVLKGNNLNFEYDNILNELDKDIENLSVK